MEITTITSDHNYSEMQSTKLQSDTSMVLPDSAPNIIQSTDQEDEDKEFLLELDPEIDVDVQPTDQQEIRNQDENIILEVTPDCNLDLGEDVQLADQFLHGEEEIRESSVDLDQDLDNGDLDDVDVENASLEVIQDSDYDVASSINCTIIMPNGQGQGICNFNMQISETQSFEDDFVLQFSDDSNPEISSLENGENIKSENVNTCQGDSQENTVIQRCVKSLKVGDLKQIFNQNETDVEDEQKSDKNESLKSFSESEDTSMKSMRDGYLKQIINQNDIDVEDEQKSDKNESLKSFSDSEDTSIKSMKNKNLKKNFIEDDSDSEDEHVSNKNQLSESDFEDSNKLKFEKKDDKIKELKRQLNAINFKIYADYWSDLKKNVDKILQRISILRNAEFSDAEIKAHLECYQDVLDLNLDEKLVSSSERVLRSSIRKKIVLNEQIKRKIMFDKFKHHVNKNNC